MSHDSFDERLSAYLDGQLAPDQCAEIESLLRQRPDLVQLLDQMRQLGNGIRQLPKQSLGADFPDRVLAAAQQAAAKTTPPAMPRSRRSWLIVAGCVVAAVAAIALAMFAFPPPDRVVKSDPPVLSPAEQAVATMLAQAEEGKAVVVRLRLTKDAIRGKALEQALAAQGISRASAAATNPAARETAQAYKSLADKAREPAGAAVVMFIEAEQTRLQKALAEVAQTPQGALAISSDGVVPSTGPGPDRGTKQEGESGGGKSTEAAIDPQNYAQHLPARGFPLLKSAGEVPQVTPKAVTEPSQKGKAARVLVVVEVIP